MQNNPLSSPANLPNPPNPQDLSSLYTKSKQKIEEVKDILILLPSSNTPDSVAAGLALYSALKEKYSGTDSQTSTKNISISSPTPLTDNFNKLPNANNVQQSVGTKNLVVTLNTEVDNIEKVITDDDQGKFNIVIETKKDTTKLSQDDVKFSFRGISAELIITVGIFNQSQLGNFLTQEPKLLEGRDIISLSHQFGAVPFGTINISNPKSSGSSEMVATLIKSIDVKPTQEITTNILAGMESATNNFSIKTNAETFTLAGWCISNHAIRGVLGGQQPAPTPFAPRSFPPSPAPRPFPTLPQQQPSVQQNPFGNFPRPPIANPNPQPFNQPQPSPSQNIPTPLVNPNQGNPPIQPQSHPNQQNSQAAPVEGTEDNNPQPKKDWYEPKVFRGGHNV